MDEQAHSSVGEREPHRDIWGLCDLLSLFAPSLALDAFSRQHYRQFTSHTGRHSHFSQGFGGTVWGSPASLAASARALTCSIRSLFSSK